MQNTVFQSVSIQKTVSQLPNRIRSKRTGTDVRFLVSVKDFVHIMIISKESSGINMAFENINIRKILETALSNNAIIVDVRKQERFRTGHIPMAVNLPLEQIEKELVTLPKSRVLIVYCDTGGSSIQAARALADMGYQVINCIGGLKNYNASLTK